MSVFTVSNQSVPILIYFYLITLSYHILFVQKIVQPPSMASNSYRRIEGNKILMSKP